MPRVKLAALGGHYVPRNTRRAVRLRRRPCRPHCYASPLRLKQKVTLCVRSPNTAHTRRPARRITCPSVPLAARGSAPAATLKAASRRKPFVQLQEPPTLTLTGRLLQLHSRPPLPILVEAPAAALQRLAVAVGLRPPWCAYAQQKTKNENPNHSPNSATRADESGTAFHSLAASLAEFQKRNYAHSAPSLLHALPCDNAGSLRQPSRQETCHAGCELRSPGRKELRALCLSEAVRGGASESKVFLDWRSSDHYRVITTIHGFSPVFTRNERARIAQAVRERRGPCPGIWEKRQTGKGIFPLEEPPSFRVAACPRRFTH